MSIRKISMNAAGEDDWAPSRNRGSEAELDITPMIDVTFLLLIFFMVASTMQQESGNVPAADNGIGVDQTAATVLIVENSGDGSPIVRVKDGPRAGDELTLDEIPDVVRLGLDPATGEAKRSHVIIKADGDLNVGAVKDVMRAIGEVDDVSSSIAVRDRNQ